MRHEAGERIPLTIADFDHEKGEDYPRRPGGGQRPPRRA